MAWKASVFYSKHFHTSLVARFNEGSEYNDIQYITEHNNTWHNDIPYNNTKHNDAHPNGTQYNDTQHNSTNYKITLSIMA